jgi:SAM-dependent methyltransferase
MLSRKQLPPSLWLEGVLHLSSHVLDVFEAKLRELGLFETALAYDGKGPGGHGGASKEETYEHYYKRFLNSASRLQCVMLDPHKAFEGIPRDLLLTLSSHRISVLDVPCGAGAGTIAALMTLKELRIAGILPMTPLSVRILGADISPYALDLYRAQLVQLEPILAGVGISVRLDTRPWDATDVQQTNDLIDDYLSEGAAYNECFVVVANFSGASKTLFQQFEDSFKQIWIRLSGRSSRFSTILWVEPNWKDGASLFKKLVQTVKSYRWFQRITRQRQNFQECSYSFHIRMQNKAVPSGVMVHYYRRES